MIANKVTNVFLGHRRRGLARLFDRRRHGGVAGAVNEHRGVSLLGLIISIAAPFVIRKLMALRAQRAPA